MKKLKTLLLKNFRRGFATNSSSSHSFVYYKEEAEDAYSENTDYRNIEFQWNDFKLSSIRAKLFYLLVDKIGSSWADEQVDPDETFEEIGFLYEELDREDFREAAKSSIDHQSRGIITAEEARDPKTVVFGGNDNSDGSTLLEEARNEGLVDEEKSPRYWW